MSASLNDERTKVFTYSDVGTDGRATPSYALAGTYWSRRSTPSGREATIAGQAGMRLDAVFTFDGSVVLQADGALRAQDGTYYKITAVLPVRSTASLKEKIVYAEYSDEQLLTVAGE